MPYCANVIRIYYKKSVDEQSITKALLENIPKSELLQVIDMPKLNCYYVHIKSIEQKQLLIKQQILEIKNSLPSTIEPLVNIPIVQDNIPNNTVETPRASTYKNNEILFKGNSNVFRSI